MADPVLFKNAGVAFTTGSATAAAYTVLGQAKSVEMPISKAELDDAVMSDVMVVVYPGILSAPITLTYRQDYTASGIDAFFWDKFDNETAFRAQVAPVNTTLAATNPGYQFSKVRVHAITPISGAHGELVAMEAQLRPQSSCTLIRVTASSS